MPDRPVLPLPIQIEDIDSAWLTAALRTQTQEVTVRKVEVVDINHGTCTKIRLKLDLDDAGRRAGIPEFVILKGGFESHSRDMAEVIHLGEVRGYRDVFPILPLPNPACYFADYDQDRRQGIVIMEDLAQRGVEFCSALKPHTFEEVARRLTVLAEFHARTWGSPDLRPEGRWGFLSQGQETLRGYMNLYLEKPEEWARFVASPRGAATSVRFHDLKTIVRAFDQLVVISRQVPHCVIRGDTHPGNFYVEPDGSPGFLDALPSRGPAMTDITYYIACALDTFDRPRWEGPLVQHYLAELRRFGAPAPSFDEAMRQYSALLLNGYIIFMVNESFYQPESINTAYTARFSAAMIEHDTLGILSHHR
jgi:Ecdysteroid kinase-like family